MSEARAYAVVRQRSGRVVNVTLWDGVSAWTPPKGCAAVPLAESAGIGWRCDPVTGVFTPPAGNEA